MSSASTSRTIKFISKAGTYTAIIMCSEGDLYQEWEGTQQDVTNIFPNFRALKPKLLFVCTSSRVAEGIATPDSIDYYFNGTKITWSGDTSSGTFAGLFKKIYPSGDNIYYGLQIVQNIVLASGFAPATIKMVAHISYGTQSDEIQASYTIPIQQATGSSFRVTIAAGDNKNFVITQKSGNGSSCILKAMAYQSGNPLTTGLSYKWYRNSQGDWVEISGQTGQMLTVQEADINTYGEFKVEVYRNNTMLGSDFQGVMDASDPYEIDPHPNPEDETITEDTNGNGTVTYTPVIVKRGTSTKAMDSLFFFTVKDAAGVFLNVLADRTTAKASYSVTRDHCMQAGSDVSVTIESQS